MLLKLCSPEFPSQWPFNSHLNRTVDRLPQNTEMYGYHGIQRSKSSPRLVILNGNTHSLFLVDRNACMYKLSHLYLAQEFNRSYRVRHLNIRKVALRMIRYIDRLANRQLTRGTDLLAIRSSWGFLYFCFLSRMPSFCSSFNRIASVLLRVFKSI